MIELKFEKIKSKGQYQSTSTATVSFIALEPGVYLLNATGPDPETREQRMNDFILNEQILFDPRDHWSGILTGSDGILVEAISTEVAINPGGRTVMKDIMSK